jgi:hypothetical protein
MASIQSTLTRNWRAFSASAVPNAPGVEKSNRNRMAMPTTSGRKVNTIPTARIRRSFSLGTRVATMAPTVGKNTASEIAHVSNPIYRSSVRSS